MIRKAFSFVAQVTSTLVVLYVLATYVPAFRVVFAGAPGGSYSTWNSTYEADPTGSDPLNQGDDWLRALKRDIRQRASAEHDWGNLSGAPTTDNGRHLEGSSRIFYESSAPTALAHSDFDNTDGVGSTVLDQGRMWYDSDNGQAFIYDGSDWDAPFPGALTGTINLLSTPRFTTAAGSAGNAFNPAAFHIRNIVQDTTIDNATSTTNADSWTTFAGNVFGGSGTAYTTGAMDMTNRSANSKVMFIATLDNDDTSASGTCSFGVFMNSMATQIGPTGTAIVDSNGNPATLVGYATNIATGTNTFELHVWHSAGGNCSAPTDPAGSLTVIDFGPD